MSIEFTPWPDDLAALYRKKGYWIGQPLTEALERQAAQRPEAVAVICGDRTITYGQLDRLSGNLAGQLALRGLGHGDRAVVQLPNIAEFYITFFALLKAGIAPVNALFSHKQSELLAYASQLRPRLFIADRRHSVFADDRFLGELRREVPELTHVLFHGAGEEDESLEALMGEAPARVVDYRPSPASQVAFFQLSGGSTGQPKLIPRTHDDYDYSVRASVDICGVTADTRYLCALPAAHNYPMSSPGALGVFHAGGTVVMAPNPDPQTCFRLIAAHGVTMVALVPPAVSLWLDAAAGSSHDLSSLALVQVGGASFAEALARQVPEKLGAKLQQVFGMAEGLVNYTRLDDPDELVFTTQGRPISPDDEVRIVDESGNAVPEGEAGLLATRGPYTFRGYYRSPEQNGRVFDRDGFYYSGDVVQRTPEGNLRVVGRVKDVINRGGEKVASEEIENLLLRHQDVTHAALVAVEDKLLGEKSCAFVVSRNEELKAVALRRHLMGLGVADYKLPDRVRFIDAMPLTPVGKIDKKILRQMANELALP
ncbi:(2,3-dihydroxybenzoyl)adenylate synthase [Allorhizobium undicola]|uniref:(2,3-dihydroxybenzoyl)adenylate synthase n=1 Tax=Allorhizobium undicola TaxID=78527 RepID=UPI003D353933